MNTFWLPALAALLTLASPYAYAQSKSSSVSKVHTSFIAADEVNWDYTPRGRGLTGTPHLEIEDETPSGTGHRNYRKAIFREYTDATFRTLKPRPPEVGTSGNSRTAYSC